jgi:retron-type reverse transcriptase
MMRNAETRLHLIRHRGQRGLPVNEAYRRLYHRALYLRAYGKLSRHQGARTPGSTLATVEGMSLEKIETIINARREERYRWTPVRRTYVSKKHGQRWPFGLPTGSDTLFQEVMRSLLDAYYEPPCSDRSHGCRPHRGGHTALRDVMQHGQATQWCLEGDLRACCDRIDPSVLAGLLHERVHDHRFLRLRRGFLKAGDLEAWTCNATDSGVPQGGVVSPICRNLGLERWDKDVQAPLSPAYTQGHRRRTTPP